MKNIYTVTLTFTDENPWDDTTTSYDIPLLSTNNADEAARIALTINTSIADNVLEDFLHAFVKETVMIENTINTNGSFSNTPQQ